MTHEIKDTRQILSPVTPFRQTFSWWRQKCSRNVSRSYMRSMKMFIYWNCSVVFALLTVWLVQYFLFQFRSLFHTFFSQCNHMWRTLKMCIKNKQTKLPFMCFMLYWIHSFKLNGFVPCWCCFPFFSLFWVLSNLFFFINPSLLCFFSTSPLYCSSAVFSLRRTQVAL